MRKIYRHGMLLISLVLFIIGDGVNWYLNEAPLFYNQKTVVFSSTAKEEPLITETEFERVLTLSERQPIYMQSSTTLIQIGVLEGNQPVTIVGEGEAYYELEFGNMTAFVRKGQGTVDEKVLPTFVHADRLTTIKTLEKTDVFTQANSKSNRLLQLEEGFRYPVVHEEKEWYVVKVGERPGYVHKSSVALDEGLPVLLYHQVLPRALMQTDISTVSLENFERQMAYLADHHFKTLTVQQLHDYLAGGLVVPNKAVVITFDDGLLSSKNYAYPVLKKYGFTAPHHIISSRLDRGSGAKVFDGGGLIRYITSKDLVALQDVYQFEAHTDALHELNKTAGIGIVFEHSKEEIMADLQRNLQYVPNALSLAYPYGQYNEMFIEATQEVGLLIGFTTREGYADLHTPTYEVNRFGITEKRSFEEFETYVDGDMTWPVKKVSHTYE